MAARLATWAGVTHLLCQQTTLCQTYFTNYAATSFIRYTNIYHHRSERVSGVSRAFPKVIVENQPFGNIPITLLMPHTWYVYKVSGSVGKYQSQTVCRRLEGVEAQSCEQTPRILIQAACCGCSTAIGASKSLVAHATTNYITNCVN